MLSLFYDKLIGKNEEYDEKKYLMFVDYTYTR